MRYRNISLNNAPGMGLAKYMYELDGSLESANLKNRELKNAIKMCARQYGQESSHQGYMIMRNGYVAGTLFMAPQDNDTLSVCMELDETKFTDCSSLQEVVIKIMNSLKQFYYEYTKIKVQIVNDNQDIDNDLSYFNWHKNMILTKIFSEMTETEKNLAGMSWRESLEARNQSDIQFPFDDEYLDEKRVLAHPKIPTGEIFNKCGKVIWTGINSKKNQRTISFNDTGIVEMRKDSLTNEGTSYSVKYSLLNSNFLVSSWGKRNFEIEETSGFTRYEENGVNTVIYKDSNKKILSFMTPIKDKSSASYDLKIDKEGKLLQIAVDFFTYKGKSKLKVNGTYALRVRPNDNWVNIQYINRHGFKNNILSHRDYEEILLPILSRIQSEGYSPEILNELSEKVIEIINNWATRNTHSKVASVNILDTEAYMLAAENSINYLKEIKGEIPLPHLKASIEKFVEKNDGKLRTGTSAMVRKRSKSQI